MKLLYVTSEAYPFCKTGGLADVAGSLPPPQAAGGVAPAGAPTHEVPLELLLTRYLRKSHATLLPV